MNEDDVVLSAQERVSVPPQEKEKVNVTPQEEVEEHASPITSTTASASRVASEFHRFKRLFKRIFSE